MSPDRRKYVRRPVNYQCWFSIDSETSLIEGRVRDVSQGGARVSCSARPSLPEMVDLYMTENRKVGRRCKVVWSSQDEFGLMFLGTTHPMQPDEAASSDDQNVVAI